MPIYYAVRDAFGVKDVVEDSKATLRGQGMDYREFEPSEGVIHQGAGRDRRIRAGLRYSQGGKRKYWLPQLVTERSTPEWIGEGRGDEGEVYAPLLEDQAEDIVHSSPDLLSRGVGGRGFEDPRFSFSSASGGGQGVDEGGGGGGGFELPFGDVEEEDEEVFEESRKYVFGDYNYPCVDVSSEEARMRVWDEEERILRDERGVYFRPTVRTPSFRVGRILGREGDEGYGATGSFVRPRFDSDGGGKGKALDIGSPGMRQTVIDKEQDRAEEVAREGGGLKLQWTRTRNTTKTKRTEGKKLLSPSPILTPRLRTISSSGAGSSSSSSGGAYSPSLTPASRVLPPDAVDLVVEDYGAAEEEMTNERRKGEPAVRGSGLRKVYRRGYVIDHDHDDPHQHHYHGDEHEGEREVGEVEVDLNGEGEEGEDSGAILRAEEEVVETIARVQTPPAYAQVPTLVSDPYFHSTGIVGEVDNPWA